MIYKKILLSWGMLILLQGCFSPRFYVLSTPQASKPLASKSTLSIGVEKVTLPKYLFKREIAIAKSSSEVVFLSDASWAEDIDEGLTKRLVGFFQKKFNQPHVYLYPWGTHKQPTLKVQVQITRFIALNAQIYLDASYEIENLKTHKTYAKLFTTVVNTSMETSSIVSHMDHAFHLLEEDIALAIYHFKNPS